MSDKQGEKEDEAATATNKAAPARPSWLRRSFKGFWWRAHCWLPNTIVSPHGSEKIYFDEKDLKDNKGTRVPEDESLDVPMVWGAEVYGPSEIDALYANLSKLGWDIDRLSGQSNSAGQWIREQRLYGAGGWYNIGYVSRKTDKRFYPRDYFAPMPDVVEDLNVEIYQLTPSLTCVLIGFVLTDMAGKWYQQELSEDRRMKRDSGPRRGSVSILGVGHLKAQAIQRSRERYRAIATTWFAQHMPGFFSNASDNSQLPTAELITTKMELCFSDLRKNEGESFFNWRKLILNAGLTDVWTCASCAGLQLVTDKLEDKLRFHTVIALRVSDVGDKQVEHFGGRQRRAFNAFCSDQVGGILAHYAGIAVLMESVSMVKLSREQLKAKQGGRKVLDVLEDIMRFFTHSMGQPTIAAELHKVSLKVGMFQHNCENFTQEHWAQNGESLSLPDVLCERTNHLAERLIEEETRVREQFGQLSSILSTRESVKAQRRMELLTVIALLVAFASLAVALPPRSSWPDVIEFLSRYHQEGNPAEKL